MSDDIDNGDDSTETEEIDLALLSDDGYASTRRNHFVTARKVSAFPSGSVSDSSGMMIAA